MNNDLLFPAVPYTPVAYRKNATEDRLTVYYRVNRDRQKRIAQAWDKIQGIYNRARDYYTAVNRLQVAAERLERLNNDGAEGMTLDSAMRSVEVLREELQAASMPTEEESQAVSNEIHEILSECVSWIQIGELQKLIPPKGSGDPNRHEEFWAQLHPKIIPEIVGALSQGTVDTDAPKS